MTTTSEDALVPLAEDAHQGGGEPRGHQVERPGDDHAPQRGRLEDRVGGRVVAAREQRAQLRGQCLLDRLDEQLPEARRTGWPRCRAQRPPVTPARPPARCPSASTRPGRPARSPGAPCRPRTLGPALRHGVTVRRIGMRASCTRSHTATGHETRHVRQRPGQGQRQRAPAGQERHQDGQRLDPEPADVVDHHRRAHGTRPAGGREQHLVEPRPPAGPGPACAA